MKKSKLKIFILISAFGFLLTACLDGEIEKNKIERATREYMERNLDESESFDFVGSFNRHDTVFMGIKRPCSGVIYDITSKDTGIKKRHIVQIIFSENYESVACIDELDFDPIE